MSVTAIDGPFIVYGQAAAAGGLGNAQDYNPHRGPSLFDQGAGILDPRFPFSYEPGGKNTRPYGWWGTTLIPVIDQVPSTLTTTAIAGAQVPVAGTALTLVSATGAGVTVGASVVNAVTGRTVTGLLAIDGAGGAVAFGQSGGVNIWDPTKCLARNVRIASVGNDSGATFTVAGYDIYGYPMTETITGSNATTASGAKAFKYVASITPAGTLSGSNVSAGQGDVIGFPLRVDRMSSIDIYWPEPTLITSSTGFTAAVTSAASATTGDVRGTYALQTASNNSRRMVMFITPSVANIGTYTGTYPSGLLGVIQA